VAARREPADRRDLVGHLLRQPRVRHQGIELPHRPGVAVVDVLHEVHQLGICGDVAAADAVDRALDGCRLAHADETGREEGDGDVLVVRAATLADPGNQPASLVLLDLPAVLARERLELDHVEAAAGDRHTAIRLAARRRDHEADDAVDVLLDIEAGLALELLLPVFTLRHRGIEALAQLGVHHVRDVAVRDHGGIDRHVGELFGRIGLTERTHRQPGVIGHEPRAETDEQHRDRAEQEIPSLSCHPADL